MGLGNLHRLERIYKYQEKNMEKQGKKVIILIEEMYNEFEFWYPFYRLREAGVEVVVVGSPSIGWQLRGN